MDAAAQRARDRDAFRWFLQKHRYAPQGRNARAGMLEEKDLDALVRGSLAPVWAWTWENVKTAEDMEIIKRNVGVARHTVDSCKHEREQARAKKEKLLHKKTYLEESLARAREREQALLASLRGVEHEHDLLIQSTSDKKQRELLKNAFNLKNNDTIRQLHALVDQALRLATVDADERTTLTPENQIDILLSEFKRMLKTTETAESVDFGDSDIAHLRGFSGTELLKWLIDIASRPHEEVPDDHEEATYAAHVEEHSRTSHDALVQIQSLLRQSQAEHIARFVETQKTYSKAHEVKQRVDQAMHAKYDLWGTGGGNIDPSNHDLAVETVDLQIQSHVNAVALNYATRAYDDVSKRVDSHRQQKQELDHKVELMSRFEERQDEIVARIRAKFRQNQELLQSLTRKQLRLLRGVADETTTTVRVENESGAQAMMQRTLVMDELRAFASLRLSSLDTAPMRKTISQRLATTTDHARPQVIAVPFDDFYIRQIRDEAAHLNGYRRLVRALGLSEYSSWLAILEALNSDECISNAHRRSTAIQNEMTAQEVSDALRQLEIDVDEDHTQTIPGAQSLLGSLHQLQDNMASTASSKLDDVLHLNTDTLQHQIPQLNQAIDNWYHQPAWAARATSLVGDLQPNQSMAMELDDLLR